MLHNLSSFNSTLVRFKLNRFRKSSRFMVVSIPLWFDSNALAETISVRNILFQFHSGSIQTLAEKLILRAMEKFQFHSGSIQTSSAKRI